MAATGKTPILLYGSTTATNVPVAGNLTNSSDGCEIAINVADKNLFFKDNTNAVNTVPIRQSSASSNGWLSSTDWSTFNGKAPAFTYTTGYIPFGQGTTTPTQDAALFWDNTNKRLGINTTSPGQTLTVKSTSGSVSQFESSVSYGTVMHIVSTAAGGRSWKIQATANGDGTLGGGYLSLIDDTANSYRLNINSSGDVIIGQGNLVIGTSGKGIDFSATSAGIIWRTGVGSPEGVVTAAVGSLYTRSDGGVGTTLYVKQSGTGNTGWAAK